MTDEISSLKIEAFRGLKNLPVIDFNRINIIASPANFGKTSLLQAVITAMNCDNGEQILYVANLFKRTKCRDFDEFKSLLYRNENIVGYDISATFGDVEMTKKLSGVFLKGENRFIGDYSANIRCKSQNIYTDVHKNLDFNRDSNGEYYNSHICFPPIAYFDFEITNVCEMTSLKNKNISSYIESYLLHFDSDITKVFIKNRKFYIRHLKFGDIPADILGSALNKCMEFANFCDKNQGKILFVENADCVCVEDSYRFFADFLIAVALEMKCRIFITTRSRILGSRLLDAAKADNAGRLVKLINLYREEDKISVKFEI